VNYASNLEFIHALDSMVSMAPDDAVQVVGGNWQIFSAMVNQSGASLNTETTVTSMDLESAQDGGGASKYMLRTKTTGADETGVNEYPVAFDDVVVATPWQFSDIAAGDGTLQRAIDKIPYVTLHVTVFNSPLQLSPEFFGLPPESKAPTTVLTTLPPGEEAKPGSAAAGKAGFYSISSIRTITNPKTNQLEYTYKIFSPKPVTSDLLSRLFGVEIPETFTASTGLDSQDAISWYYAHVFQSYPIPYPRVTFQEPIVGRGVYYTSGMESFISCMETNALMGKNVAKLIVDDMTVDKKTPSAESGQKVVGGENLKSEFTGMDMGEL
jgi:prenylcysteine oxidase/farnesylcysteine lyase